MRQGHCSGAACCQQAPLGCCATLRQSVGAGTVALADGHRRIVGRLADRMGRKRLAEAS